jgi:hypothetical protein
MSDILLACSWPNLAERYAIALRDAVRFVCSEVDAIGIVATGTIIRGTSHPSSDLDLYVIHQPPVRRRIQRFSGAGVPTEIFINPPSAIRTYFSEEHEDGRPITAHMLATGHVVYERGTELESLRVEATQWLQRPSFPNEDVAIRARYAAATTFEDSTDVTRDDPETTTMLRSHAVTSMLEFWCRVKDGRIPRRKDLLARVAELDPTLGALARRVFSDATFTERELAAAEVADRTIGVRGFFEWDSGPQPVANDQAANQIEAGRAGRLPSAGRTEST